MQHPFLEQKEDADEDDHRSAAAPSSAGDGAPPHSRIHRSRPSMAESHSHGHPTATVPDELRCTYRSKPCPNERARKRNGTFHKLCQEHRLRANENQRNMQRRLRERRRQELDQAERRSLDDSAPLDEDADVDDWGLYDIEPLAEPANLQQEDLEALQLLWERKDRRP